MRCYTHIVQPQPFKKTRSESKSLQKDLRTTSSQESTNPEPNRKAPRPIMQTKITKTHQGLVQIPIPFRPEIIQQLYLSHNKISNVKGKLGIFVSLRNLNLSYNQLTDTGEFIREIMGNEDGNSNRIQLRMLYIRMNRFQYGYQDQIIKMIDGLERFQDFILTPEKRQESSGESPRQVFQLAHKVSEFFLPSYSQLYSSIQSLTRIYELLSSSSNLLSSINSSSVTQQYEKVISKLSLQLQPRKEIKYLPASRKEALMIILDYEVACIQLGQRSNQQGNHFNQIVRQILLLFKNRNNFQLINTLQQESGTKESEFESGSLENLCNKFGEIYQARRHAIFEPNPGRYLEKIDPNQVKDHPFFQYVNYDQKKSQKSLKSLDGDRRRSKNTIVREFKRFNDDSLDNCHESRSPVYQNMPIIVYERNYLEIVQQIWESKLKSLIKIYDLVIHKLKQVGGSKELPSDLNYITVQNGLLDKKLDSEVYLQDNQIQEDNRKTLPKFGNHQRRKKQSEQINIKNKEEKRDFHPQDLSHYSIYQINLAYKVLMALKKNKNRKKRRRNTVKMN